MALLGKPAVAPGGNYRTNAMWVRKTPEEIEREHGRLWRALGGPTVLSVLSFLIMAVGLVSPGKTQPTTVYRAPGEVVSIALKTAVITWIVAYFCQFFFRKPLFSPWSRRTVICNACYQVKFPDGRDTCDCGGKFEDFGLWKWAEDNGAEGRGDP